MVQLASLGRLALVDRASPIMGICAGPGKHEPAPSRRTQEPKPLTRASSEARVSLIDHAETAASDRFHGLESDVGLGPIGFEQAEAVAAAFAADRASAVDSSAMP